MPEHDWGESELSKHNTTSIVDQLEGEIETLSPEKVAEAEAQIVEAIENKTNPGAVLSSVLKILKGVFLAVVLVAVVSGCMTWTPEVKNTNKIQREALLNYAKNQALLHRAQQEAFRKEAYAHIETAFLYDLKMIERKADETGKVDAEKAITWVVERNKERTAKRAEADQKVAEIQEKVLIASEDLNTALRLDALIAEWSDAGVSAEMTQQMTNSIIDIYKDK